MLNAGRGCQWDGNPYTEAVHAFKSSARYQFNYKAKSEDFSFCTLTQPKFSPQHPEEKREWINSPKHRIDDKGIQFRETRGRIPAVIKVTR